MACGRAIDAAFADFQGMDPSPSQWLVFAVLVHAQTGGRDDGSRNPLRVAGAGWTGLVGLASSGAERPATALFATEADGCRAAAVLCQFAEYRAVQSAYRTGDRISLASALVESPLRNVMDLSRLVEEVRNRTISRRDLRGLFRLVLRHLIVAPPRSTPISPGPD